MSTVETRNGASSRPAPRVPERGGESAARQPRAVEDASRRIALYLRAAWGIAPLVRIARIQSARTVPSPAAAPEMAEAPPLMRPVVTERLLLLPRPDPGEWPGLTISQLRFASAAHAAAHLHWPVARFDPGSLRPLQRALTGLIEDARVERLALACYPGLRAWWLPFHRTGPDSARTASALMARLARALLDPDYEDPDSWVARGRALFEAAWVQNGHDPGLARRLGNLLGNELGQMRIQFNTRTWCPEAAYRDDNSLLWNVPPAPLSLPRDETTPEHSAAAQADPQPHERDMRDMRGTSPDTPPQTRNNTDARDTAPQAAGMRADEGPPIAQTGETHRYREWDYLIRRYRPDWCTVRALTHGAHDDTPRDGTSHVHDPLASSPMPAPACSRLEALLRATRPREPVGKTRTDEGDVLDLDVCIAARIDARRGAPRHVKGFVVRRTRHRDEPLAVLLDLSASAGAHIGIALQTGLLLAQALRGIGRPCAIYGFRSDGRQRVEFHVFKDFGEPWSDALHDRLARVQPGLSTRLGAALRHTGRCISRQAARMSAGSASVLLVSDGEPFDIDSFDPRYLREDARRALVELAGQGLRCGCLALDPQRLREAQTLFGPAHVAPLANAAGLIPALNRLADVIG